MGIFKEICHKCIIEELEHELNTNVLLFMADGFAILGNLQKVEKDRVALLTKASLPGVSFVLTRSPGGLITESLNKKVDLCAVIAKGSGLSTNPFEDNLI
jgi:uncharacterized membrane protein YqgA involved in biofilm formation